MAIFLDNMTQQLLRLDKPFRNQVAFAAVYREGETLNCCISFCRILISHEGPVWAIERKGDFLVSGSSDKTVSKCSFALTCVCLFHQKPSMQGQGK